MCINCGQIYRALKKFFLAKIMLVLLPPLPRRQYRADWPLVVNMSKLLQRYNWARYGLQWEVVGNGDMLPNLKSVANVQVDT